MQVPPEWCKFIIVALLNPDNFEWAKALLISQLWTYILEGSNSQTTVPFVLPEKCISDERVICNHILAEQEVSSKINISTPQAKEIEAAPARPAASTSVAHAHRKRKDKAPVVETEARRSFRLQEINKGFKRHSCQDKLCFVGNMP